MNDREQLVTDTLDHREGEAFARIAAAHARRRRAMKQAGLATSLIVATLLVFTRQPPQSVPVIADTTPAIPPKPVFEILSDQELIAQFKGQPVMFLKDGASITGIVFLDDRETRGRL